MNRSLFFAVNYGSALAAGGIQFLAMTWFARSLAPSDYSLLAWTFSLFPHYLLLVDMGLQSELVRRFAIANPHERERLRAEALGIRLLVAGTSLLVFGVQAFVAGIGLMHASATASFLLSLFPAAYLYTAEAEGFAAHLVLRTVLMRCARLAGFALCLLVHILLLARPHVLEPTALFTLCAAYPLAWLGVLMAFYVSKPKQGENAVSLRASFDARRLGALASSCKEYVTAFGFSWVANAFFLVGITRQFGEGSLAGYFFAQTLCVPIALALQVLSSMTIAGKAHPLAWAGTFVATVCYGALLAFTPLIAFASGAQVAAAAKIQIPWLLPAHLLMTIGGILGVRLFASGRKAIVWISTASSVPVFLVCWLVFAARPELRALVPAGADFLVTFSVPFLILFTAHTKAGRA